MSLLSLPKGVVLLEPERLTIFSGSKQPPAIFSYPAGSVVSPDFVNLLEFETAFTDFLKNNPFSFLHVVIALSPRVVFTKKFKRTTPDQDQGVIDNFLRETGIAPEKIRTRVWNINGDRLVITVLLSLYGSVMKVLSEQGKKVDSVVPVAADTKDIVLASAADRSFLAKYNLLIPVQIGRKSDAIPMTEREKSRMLFILGMLFIGCAVLLGILLIGNFFSSKKQTGQPAMKTSGTALPLAPVPVDYLKNKADANVHILNGTGKSGDAAKAAALVKSLGYTVVETGNNDVQGVADTVVTAVPRVPAQWTLELVSELGKNFERVASVSAKTGAAYAITIVTGK